MNLRSKKGVTLIILCIMIIVLIIITSITFKESSSQLQIKNVNNLYSDIETLNAAISQYYIRNEKLPVLGKYCEGQQNLASELGGLDIINPNDNGSYYVIDLSKLDNLTLNYGREYKNWTSSPDECKDIYIINETTLQIYYVKGIKLDGEMYYTSSIQK